MATEDLASWQNFLKIIFVKENIGEAMNDNIILYKMMRDRGQIQSYGGREIRFPIQDQRQEGVGWVPNAATALPTATVSSALEATFNVRNMYGVGELDDMVIEDSRASNFAYRSSLKKTREDLLLSLTQDISAAMYSDGRAEMAIMPAADDVNPVIFSQPLHTRKGMIQDIIDGTDPTNQRLTAAGVTAVDQQTGGVTFSSAPTGTALGDYAVLTGTIGAAGEQRAIFGIEAGSRATNPSLSIYGNIDRTTVGNEAWQGNESTAGGNLRQWTARLTNDMLTLARRRSSVRVSDYVAITNWDIVQEIFEELAPDRQIVVKGAEAMQLAPGFATGSKMSGEPVAFFNGNIPIHADEMAPANQMFLLNMSSWFLYETHPPELIDRDGSVLHRFIDRPAYQFRYLWRAEMFTNNPAGQIFIGDLAQA